MIYVVWGETRVHKKSWLSAKVDIQLVRGVLHQFLTNLKFVTVTPESPCFRGGGQCVGKLKF